MHNLYLRYFPQTSYRNTFLVNDFAEIARAVGGSQEWNNIRDSGCHLTCLAMIAGMDPASLGSALGRKAYFAADKSIPAKRLNGTKGDLVWDQNFPSESGLSIEIGPIWHTELKRKVKLLFKCVGTYTQSIADSKVTISKAITCGNHIVCGPPDHSVLVAGFGAKGPFIWDPDVEPKHLKAMMAGEVDLGRFAKEFQSVKKLDICEYECKITLV